MPRRRLLAGSVIRLPHSPGRPATSVSETIPSDWPHITLTLVMTGQVSLPPFRNTCGAPSARLLAAGRAGHVVNVWGVVNSGPSRMSEGRPEPPPLARVVRREISVVRREGELLRLRVQVRQMPGSPHLEVRPEDVQAFADVRLVELAVVPVRRPGAGHVAAERRSGRDRLGRRIAPGDGERSRRVGGGASSQEARGAASLRP